jgi:hypothetical protein
VTKVTGSFTFLDEVRGGSGLLVSGASLVGFGRVVSASTGAGSTNTSSDYTGRACCAGSTTSSRAEASSSSIVASVFAERSNTFAGDSSVT